MLSRRHILRVVPKKSAAAFSGLFELKQAKNDAEMGSFVWRAERSYETGRSAETHLASIHIREIAPPKRLLEC